LAELTKQVLEVGVEVEMSEHLGYDQHAVEGRGGVNSGDGTGAKRVLSEVGPVQIDVLRDRDGSFDPKSVRERQCRLGGAVFAGPRPRRTRR
jgi:putative transposase